MAEEPELNLDALSDDGAGAEADALPDILGAESLEAPVEAEPSLEGELALPEPDGPTASSADAEMMPPTTADDAMAIEPADAAAAPDGLTATPLPAPPAIETPPAIQPDPAGPVAVQPTTDAPPANAPASTSGADASPDFMEALLQVLAAFGKLLDALPGWASMALAATLAALLGLVIGWRLSRPAAAGGSLHDTGAAPTVRPALPAPENPAFKNYQLFLESKGVSAKERDAQMRAFSDRYREMRQNLRDLIPGNKELDEQVELVRDALDAGDFDRVYGLLTRIGNKENSDGTEKRTAALKHLMAAAIAKSVAGDLQMSRLEYDSAAENFRQAVEALPPFQEDMHAEFLNKYGTASYQAGHHETAIAAFERALQILEKRLGKNHPDVATALNNLALLHYSRGNYDAAEPLYKRSLVIDEQTLGVDHTGVATDLNNLALLYKKKGNLEEAEPLLRRAMEIKEKNFDPGHPSLVTGLRNYASLLRSLGREEEADIYERRATVLPPSRTGIAAE